MSVRLTDHVGTTDFIRESYDRIGEPLNLVDGGRRWFATILRQQYAYVEGTQGLVLGGTPWLSALMLKMVERTTVVDFNPAMLGRCERSVLSTDSVNARDRITFLQANWLELPSAVPEVQLIVGDNSFAFLKWPHQWENLLDLLADRLTDGGVVVCRFLSAPATHRRLRSKAIVDAALAERRPLNYTAVRVALLFAHWDATAYTIRPESALETFQEEKGEFQRLFTDGPNLENDLLSIEKYRGTNALFFAPPLAEVLAMFERHFHVRAIYFGPYAMSQYFPVIAACKSFENS